MKVFIYIIGAIAFVGMLIGGGAVGEDKPVAAAVVFFISMFVEWLCIRWDRDHVQ